MEQKGLIWRYYSHFVNRVNVFFYRRLELTDEMTGGNWYRVLCLGLKYDYQNNQLVTPDMRSVPKVYDVYILSTAPWKNPSAWSDKLKWVQKYFPETFHKRLILSHRKDLLRGDYLIDDRDGHGAKDFHGEWIHFGSEKFPNWDVVTKYLLDKAEEDK